MRAVGKKPIECFLVCQFRGKVIFSSRNLFFKVRFKNTVFYFCYFSFLSGYHYYAGKRPKCGWGVAIVAVLPNFFQRERLLLFPSKPPQKASREHEEGPYPLEKAALYTLLPTYSRHQGTCPASQEWPLELGRWKLLAGQWADSLPCPRLELGWGVGVWGVDMELVVLFINFGVFHL